MLSRFGPRLVAVLGLFAASACASLSPGDAAHPHFLGGDDAARAIDRDVGDVLAVEQPSLRVGRAQCPLLLNLTGNNARATCTIDVNGLPVRVGVVSPDGRTEVVEPVDAVVVESSAERDLQSGLSRWYGEDFHVHCEGDAVRIIRADETQSCTATGPDGLRKVLPVRSRGATGTLVRYGNLPSTETLFHRIFGRAAERTTGGVTLRGRDVERYLASYAGSLATEDLRRRRLIGTPRCPAHIVLAGLQRVTCVVPMGDKNVPYSVRFDDGRGIVFQSGATAFSAAVIQARAERFVDRMAARDGPAQHAIVACGKATTLLLEPGSSIECTVRTFRNERILLITLVAFSEVGTFRYDLAS